MITKSIEISDNVYLRHIKTNKFKTNYISFDFIAPLERERAHLNSMLPLILMRATKKYPSQSEINKRLQCLYSGNISASVTAFGQYQCFGMKMNMLNDRFSKDVSITNGMVDLLCEMLFNPYLVNGAFDEKYTDDKKNDLIDTVESLKNSKGSYAIKRLKEEMCKNEVFSISKYGEIENIKKITKESLYNAYKEALSIYPIEIYAVGDMDIDAIASKLKQYFKSIKRNPIRVPEIELIKEAKEIKQVTEVEKINQARLVLGFRTGYDYKENKYHIVQLFNEILGGSPTSKLFLNVREKMSLCYSCRSIVNQKDGLMIISAGIEAKNREIAEKAIINQLEAIKNGNITEEEFSSAKKSIINGYISISDSASSEHAWSFYRSLCGINTTPQLESEKIKNTTIEQIKEFANRITLDTVYFLKGEEE
ncbi:MAG: insulinase family protein [Clostridia bacterium]|nr:insulinase family protein [Clostridia bacterium]